MNIEVAKEMQYMSDRITTVEHTMQAMWQRMQPLTKFYDWAKETHPELLDQYASLSELRELGRDDGITLRSFGNAIPKAEGQPVSYGDGNI